MPYAMRKIRGKDLYKVWNTQTGEIKSSGSTKKDAKAQLRLLRGLAAKEAGSLKADQIKEVIDNSYNNKKEGAPTGYVIDKDLSDGRVKVYKDLNSDQVIVAHRGSSGWKDWLDNAYYATTGNIKGSNTYKTHKKKHQAAVDKYGSNNIISVGHSRAGKYVEELNKEQPVKEVITYNKAVGLHDAFQKNPENQTDIRTSKDLVSALTPFQRSKNKVVTIPEKSWNLLKAHGTSALSSLGNKLIGKGFKQMRVGDMRKFIKAFKKAKYGEKWTGGAKYNKKKLVEMIKPMLQDDDIDELIGGSVWTDFVKDFSAKHGLKYACALSKYKEPLKKAYKLKKENKEWYEPLKSTGEIGVGPDEIPTPVEQPEPNITFKIEEKEPEPETYKPLPPIQSQRELTLIGFKINELKDILAGYKIKGVSKMKKDDMIQAILKHENIPEGMKWGKYPSLYSDFKEAHTCFNEMDRYKKSEAHLLKMIEQESAKPKTPETRERLLKFKNKLTELRELMEKCKGLLKRDYGAEAEALEKKYGKSGNGVMSGGNRWTDFVKDYAKQYNTTYGCALSDLGIKHAYKLFKDGKEWFIPKAKEIEIQTDDFIEPEPEKAPEVIEPVVNRIEEKIKQLEEEGAAHGAVSYNSATIITDIAFVNLMKKYGGRCLITKVQDDFGIDIGLDVNNQRSKTLVLNYPNRLKIFGEALKECIDRGVRLILIPLSLKFGTGASGHANMLVYRPFKRIVERYEPHGVAYGNSVSDNKVFNAQLREIWEEKLTPYIGPVRYREPDEICPNPRGFQSLEGQLKSLSSEGGGFCSMWSFFVAEMIFINPDKSTKEVLEEVFRITNSEPAYLKNVIRGYVLDAERGLDKLLKELGKPGFKFTGKKSYETIYDVKSELDTWLLNTIFDTKKYSDAPPDFEPLPDATIRSEDDVSKLREIYYNKLKQLTINDLDTIMSIYGLKAARGIKKDEYITFIVKKLERGDWGKYGATGLKDIDTIIERELHKKKGDYTPRLARTGYFMVDFSGPGGITGSGVMSAGRFNLGRALSKAFDPKKNGVAKAFNKVGSELTTGANKMVEGLNKINPMMIALNNDKSRKLMAQSGELTHDYLLPAVVSAGKPLYDTSAMAASTLLTGNPVLGKVAADELWNKMVAEPGYDPRQNQHSEILGDISGKVGKIGATALGNAYK